MGSSAASAPPPPPGELIELRELMAESDLVKRLMWSGLLAAIGALASIATQRLAAMIWLRAFGEEPPE